MSSSIFFRFKSQKDTLPIAFDGTSLSVWEVKRDIITLSKLGDGKDFDLEIYAADNNERYDDDTVQIPRSSTVIAARRPARVPGNGNGSRYVTGTMPANARNRRAAPNTGASGSGNAPALDTLNPNMTEEERLQQILKTNDESFKAEQQAASHQGPARPFNKAAQVPGRAPPNGYSCHRCGQVGHWIQACPTNNDPSYDGRAKYKQVKGIPRSSLEKIEVPYEDGEEGKIDYSRLPQGAMYDLNNNWYIFKPDTAQWNKFQQEQSEIKEKAKDDTAEKEIRERGIECPIHKGMLNEPVKTPCCGKTYCRDCIDTALIDNDLLCPNCEEQVLLDSLEQDDDMLAKLRKWDEDKKKEREEKTAAANAAISVAKSPAAAATPKEDEGKSPAAGESAASTPTSRKRSADGELPNDRNPANFAMKKNRTNSNAGTPSSNPSNSNTPIPHPPRAPAADVAAAAEVQRQMNAAVSMGNVQNMPAMMNPMMNFNPMMMGMPNMMGNMGNMNMGSMQGYGGMGMGNMNNGWNGDGGWNGNNGMMGNQGWQGGYGNGNGYGRGGYGGGGYGGRGGMQNGGGNQNGAYDRPPVRGYRQQRGGYNHRSQDYRQV